MLSSRAGRAIPVDLGRRIGGLLLALPIVAGAMWWTSPWGLTFLVIIVAGMCGWELAALRTSHLPTRVSAAIATGSIPLIAHLTGLLTPDPAVAALITIVVLVAAGALLVSYERSASAMGVRVILGAMLYCGIPLACFLALRASSVYWALLALAVTWGGDVAAYLVGSVFGRHPLSPKLSPRKTIEGACASLVASLALGSLLASRLGPPGFVHAQLLALAANLSAQGGDAFESFLKRKAGVKDSGSLALGHGGLLDVMDGLCFAAPLIYVCRALAW